MIAGQTPGAWLADVLLGILVTGGLSVAIGATAPRWPSRWLQRDVGPLRLLPGDTVARYERLGARWWKRVLPEAGAMFGGQSKNKAPDYTDPASVRRYLVEVRRAEWVHWLSMLTWLPLPWFQPWPLALFFLLVTAAGNMGAQIILRYNKVRLYGLLESSS